MLMMVIAYSLAAPLLTVFVWSKAWSLLAGSIFGFSLLVGMGYVNAQPLLCELLPERLRSSAIGFMNMTSCFVGGAGVLIAGALKNSFGLTNAFASLAVIQGSVAVMLLITFTTVLRRDLERAAHTMRAETRDTIAADPSPALAADRTRT
jgi:MFS family permease